MRGRVTATWGAQHSPAPTREKVSAPHMSPDIGLQWPAGTSGSKPACDKVSARTTHPRVQWKKTHLWGLGSRPRAGEPLRSPAVGARLLNTAGGGPASTFSPSCLVWARPAVGTATLPLVWGGGGLGRRLSSANAGRQGTRAFTSRLNKPKTEISAPAILPGLDGAWEARAPRGDRLGRANRGVPLLPG